MKAGRRSDARRGGFVAGVLVVALVASLVTAILPTTPHAAAAPMPIPAACFGHSVGPGGTYQTAAQHRNAAVFLLNTYDCAPSTSNASNVFIAAATAAVRYPEGSAGADRITFTQTARVTVDRVGCIGPNDPNLSFPPPCHTDGLTWIQVQTLIDWPATITGAVVPGFSTAIIRQPGAAWTTATPLPVTLTRDGTCGMEARPSVDFPRRGGLSDLTCSYDITWATQPTGEMLVAFPFSTGVGNSATGGNDRFLFVCDVTNTICTEGGTYDWASAGLATAIARLARGTSDPTAVAAASPTGTDGEWQLDGTGSTAVAPKTISEYRWTVPGVGELTGATPTVTVPRASLPLVVELEVTDSAGGTATTSVQLAQRLTLSQLAIDPEAPEVGTDPFTATITVRNDGAWTVADVATTLDSATPELVAVAGPSDPTTVESLAPGATATFTYPLTATDAGAATLTASVSADDDGSVIGDGPVNRNFTVAGRALTVELGAEPPTPIAGREFEVIATVRNTGTVDVTSIAPTGLLTATPSTGVTVDSPTPASIATLAPDATAELRIPVTAEDAGEITLALEVSGQTVDGAVTADASLDVAVASDAIVVTTTGDESMPPGFTADDLCDVDDAEGLQCPLRAAIDLANARAEHTSITFAIETSEVPTIGVAASLVATSRVDIDATTQPGGWVEVAGGVSVTESGLVLRGAGSTVRGLVVNGFAGGAGIVAAGDDVIVAGNRIGTDVTGTSGLPNAIGVRVEGDDVVIGGTSGTSLDGCTGDCNLISGNTETGVHLHATSAEAHISVLGNWIGVDATGQAVVEPVSHHGVRAVTDLVLPGDARIATVGGPTARTGAAPGNVVVAATGIQVVRGDVQGNLVGLDASGTIALIPPSRAETGIFLDLSESGGPTAGHRNVVGGYAVPGGPASDPDFDLSLPEGAAQGIFVGGGSTSEHDFSGTDITGMHPIPNDFGIHVHHLGTIDHALASGNGVGIFAQGAFDTEGTIVGLAADGSTPLANSIGILGTTDSLEVGVDGGTCESVPCAVVSGNRREGIRYAGTHLVNGSWGSFAMRGVFVGTDASGTETLANGGDGVRVTGVSALRIGGSGATSPGGRCVYPCNVVAGNAGAEVVVHLEETSGDEQPTIQGNHIGANVDGTPLPSAGPGISLVIHDADAQPLIGGGLGAAPGVGNVIAGNQGAAVAVTDAGGASVIGPDAGGNRVFANGGGIAYDVGTLVPTVRSELLSAVRLEGGGLAVRGTGALSAVGGVDPRIDLYGSTTCWPGGQGERPIVSFEASGFLTDTWRVVVDGVPSSLLFVTVTRTLPNGTSRYSECVRVAAGGETALTEAASAGDTVLEVAHTEGFAVGDTIRIGEGAGAETRRIVAFGSIVVDRPVQLDHPAGTPVIVVGTNEPPGTPPPTSPTTSPPTSNPPTSNPPAAGPGATPAATPGATPGGPAPGLRRTIRLEPTFTG